MPLCKPSPEKSFLKAWGFDKDYCFNCKKKNDEVDCMLFQCASCKQAYYCSLTCLNQDLLEHQKRCRIGGFCSDAAIRVPDRIMTSDVFLSPSSASDSAKSTKKKLQLQEESKTKLKQISLCRDSPKEKKKAAAASPKKAKGRAEKLSKETQASKDKTEDNHKKTDLIPTKIPFSSAESKSGNSRSTKSTAELSDASGTTRDDRDKADINSSCEVMKALALLPDVSSTTSPGSMASSTSRSRILNRPPLSPRETVSLCHTEQEKLDVSWKKPAWSSELGMLRKTRNGNKIRNGVTDVSRPTSKGVDRD